MDLEELILAFKELGIDVDKAEATKLLERYKKNSIIFFIQLAHPKTFTCMQ